MSEHLSRKLNSYIARTRTTEGKITIFTSIVAAFVLVCVVVIFNVNVPQAVAANNVQTAVTVLNTPPTFDTNAAESSASTTTTPTNAGTAITWTVQASDSSSDNYYILVCKTSGTPVAGAGGGTPSCSGGASDTWAVSTSTTASGVRGYVSTTTVDYFPFNAESNAWFVYICDNNSTFARCNNTANQGTPNNDDASPFVMNHIPRFFTVSNTGPIVPGTSITWNATANDPDVLGGADQVRLVVCRTAGFSNGQCTGGNAFATSTLSTTNPSTSTPFAIPAQDRSYSAFTYIVDNHNLAATSSFQGFNSSFSVSNVSPTISVASISFLDRDGTTPGQLTLTVPSATSGPYRVKFTVADNNGCITTTSTPEISATVMNTYRSGIASSSCQNASGHYNSNNCYPAASGNFSPFLTCTQDAASCSGTTDSDATFTCIYSLWFNADPTDGASSAVSQYFAENWLASVRATDDNGGSSGYVDSTSFPAELISFLAFDVSTTSVGYGALQPGETTTPMIATTDLRAVGNVGLDETIYGSTMCTTWSTNGGSGAPDNCDVGGVNAATKIPITQQKVATSSVAYTSSAAVTVLASTSPRSVTINVNKTTSTSTIQSKNTYWGIEIPFSITQAGTYNGQNTITGVKSSPANW